MLLDKTPRLRRSTFESHRAEARLEQVKFIPLFSKEVQLLLQDFELAAILTASHPRPGTTPTVVTSLWLRLHNWTIVTTISRVSLGAVALG